MVLTRADREWIESRARAVGFDLAGIADLPGPAGAAAVENDRRYAAWIAAGHAGEMEYLKRADEAGEFLRSDPRRSMPWARSVIVCAVNYNVDAPRSIDAAAPTKGWIARYAWSGAAACPERSRRTDGEELHAGSDYHDVLLSRLRVLEAELMQRFGHGAASNQVLEAPEAPEAPDLLEALQVRCYVDTGPLVERELAVRAGVGWIGRNTCVLDQQQGSWLLLGVIVTSLELERAAWSVPAADRCGSCTRCIDACPTDALFRPDVLALRPGGERGMDAARCIAYLTIEKKGSIAEELRPLMGRQVFGCDICQDVCPWNSKPHRKTPTAAPGLLPPRRELINPALEWLAGMDGPAFNRVFRGSPLERTRRKRILRNVAIAMGNSGEQRYLPQLEAWVAGGDDLLAEAAAWAAGRLRNAMHREPMPESRRP